MPLTLLDRLQRRFGWFAVPNVTIFLMAGQAVLYVASMLPQGVSLDRVALDPAKVMQGEVWRLATFMFAPPNERPLFVIFYFILFHLFGTTLEQQWGTFKYNAFLFIGWFANVAAAFIGWAILGQQLGIAGNADAMKLLSAPASNMFLYSSLFLAFARLYPDFTLNLFFILPIRIKWLALLQWLTYAYLCIRGGWMTRMLIIATVLNYLLFLGGNTGANCGKATGGGRFKPARSGPHRRQSTPASPAAYRATNRRGRCFATAQNVRASAAIARSISAIMSM